MRFNKGTRRHGHVAVSPLGAVGGKPTREHRIRVRSQRLERLQFQASGPPRQCARREGAGGRLTARPQASLYNLGGSFEGDAAATIPLHGLFVHITEGLGTSLTAIHSGFLHLHQFYWRPVTAKT